MQLQKCPSHWLARYGTQYHAWRYLDSSRDKIGRALYYRPIGLVEGFFDTDGTEYEGRSDVNTGIFVEIWTSLDHQTIRKKLLLTWAVLRTQHVLLSAQDRDGLDFLPEGGADDVLRGRRFFVVRQPENIQQLLREAEDSMVFVEDSYDRVDEPDFRRHIMNSSRTVDPGLALAKLFVLPPELLLGGTYRQDFHLTIGHQVTDGLTQLRWLSHLVELLNVPANTLTDQLRRVYQTDVRARLPRAQEDLYPPIPGSVARQRWFWAISRILRHVKKPVPAAFQNPLRRAVPGPPHLLLNLALENSSTTLGPLRTTQELSKRRSPLRPLPTSAPSANLLG